MWTIDKCKQAIFTLSIIKRGLFKSGAPAAYSIGEEWEANEGRIWNKMKFDAVLRLWKGSRVHILRKADTQVPKREETEAAIHNIV